MATPKQEKRFEYKGFPCVVLSMPMAYRCGYVGLPKDTEIDTDSIDCHCGITYSDNRLHCQDDTERLWIGFDCAHCCDGYDATKARELFKDDKDVIRQLEIMAEYFEICNEENPVRTLEYCEEQCRNIVKQLIKRGINP